jgi:hypothetical protein
MAFDSTKLARMGHANGITFWIYKTDDLPADVDTQDYFIEAITQINEGDIIYTLADQAGAKAFGFFICSLNDGTNIDCDDILNAGVDTD